MVHHGGAGTLAAGLRAGVPTIVCAIQGDQPFHGSLLQARGYGQYLGMVGAVPPAKLAEAIAAVVGGAAMGAAVRALGAQLQQEDGLATAVEFMERMATTFEYPWPIKSRLPPTALRHC